MTIDGFRLPPILDPRTQTSRPMPGPVAINDSTTHRAPKNCKLLTRRRPDCCTSPIRWVTTAVDYVPGKCNFYRNPPGALNVDDRTRTAIKSRCGIRPHRRRHQQQAALVRDEIELREATGTAQGKSRALSAEIVALFRARDDWRGTERDHFEPSTSLCSVQGVASFFCRAVARDR